MVARTINMNSKQVNKSEERGMVARTINKLQQNVLCPYWRQFVFIFMYAAHTGGDLYFCV